MIFNYLMISYLMFYELVTHVHMLSTSKCSCSLDTCRSLLYLVLEPIALRDAFQCQDVAREGVPNIRESICVEVAISFCIE